MPLSDYLPASLQPEKLAECSDEDKKSADKDRTFWRTQIVDFLKYLEANAKLLKLSDSEATAASKWTTEEKTWWDDHLSLCPVDVSNRSKKIMESFDSDLDKITTIYYTVLSKKPAAESKTLANQIAPNKLKEKITQSLDSTTSDANNKAAQEKQAKSEELKNRTIWTEIKIALKTAMVYLIPMAYILLGLRFAGYAANDLFYKPLPYRVLASIYAFLYTPVLFFYYLYRLFFGEELTFEGLFPLFPYDPKTEMTLANRFFGYPYTDTLSEWVTKKRATWEEEQLAVISNTSEVLAAVIKAKEEALASN